jgi:RNA polymerase sigma factor (sigma-70 family)
MNKLYQEHKHLIYSVVNKIQKSTGIDRDELRSEANETFVKCAMRFDPNRGIKFSTYLVKCLQLNLYRMARKKAWRESKETNELFDIAGRDTSEDIIFNVTLESLSRDARMCADLALHPPEEMRELIDRKDDTVWAKKITKSHIKKYLYNQGWNPRQIDNAFSEINQLLSA